MKSLIRKILREQEEEIIQAPSFAFFNYDWNDVLDWADDRLFRMNGNIDLSESNITTLGGLVEVGGNLNLRFCGNLQSLGKLRSVGGYLGLFGCKNLQSLGELRSVNGKLDLQNCKNLQSLGELRSVGSNLDLSFCQNLQSLGELRSVGRDLDLRYAAIAETMTDEEIRNQIDVKGRIIRK